MPTQNKKKEIVPDSERHTIKKRRKSHRLPAAVLLTRKAVKPAQKNCRFYWLHRLHRLHRLHPLHRLHQFLGVRMTTESFSALLVGSTNSLRLKLESCSTDEGRHCAVGAWGAARGRGTGGCEEGRHGRWVPTPNVRKAELSTC